MEGKNHLGIYLGRETATVVCMSAGGSGGVLDSFTVTTESQGEQSRPGIKQLAHLVAQSCAARQLNFSGVAIALDCSMFMQHNIHSAFTEANQIASTVRFDTEETLATDITNLAITFKITSSDEAGSELVAFTTEHKVLSDIIGAFQANNIDPMTIQPDVNCLAAFICRNMPLEGDSNSLFAVFSRQRGYFIGLSSSGKLSFIRTFLLGPTQNRSDFLARELLVTGTLAGHSELINSVKVCVSDSSVEPAGLTARTGIRTELLDLLANQSVTENLDEQIEPVQFAIACGAALTVSQKAATANFRDDFMPYQGKKEKIRKTVQFFSIAVTVLIFAVGAYFQLQLLQAKKYQSRLEGKLAEQYSVVMQGKKLSAREGVVKKLAGELRRIRDVKSGQLSVTGRESVSAKLTLALEAFNKCAGKTNLDIDSVSITAKSISIAGSTSSRKNTLQLFTALKARLNILQQRLHSKGGRDNFRITVEIKKG
ncbi:MAG: type IV pilus biogenesis protein PilM [Planctomycetota bacterium]